MKSVSRKMAKGLSISLLMGCTFMASFSAWAENITDMAGRSVAIPAKVERILLGEGRLFYAVSLLEGQKPFDRIVGWQGDFRKLDTQTYAVYKAKFPQVDNIPLIGNTTADSISPEKVLTLNPDIAIFGLSGHGPGKNSELVKQLEKAGVPVVFVDFRTSPLKNTLPSMRVLGKVLHREQQANDYIKFYEDNVRKVTEITSKIPADKKPSVFIELRAGAMEECCGTAGKGNMGDFIDQAGGNNMAKNLLPGALGTVNLEKVLSANPDIYIASGGKAPDNNAPGVSLGAQVTKAQAQSSLQTILDRKGINTLSAVKNGRSYGIWHNFYNSPYNVLAIQIFAKWFYPEQFADLDPNKTMNSLYSQFLAIEPTGTYWVDSTK
ncbi:periplasmic binding family protein [Yersinia ruckeri ATCC 29473]|uniref:Solute-binding periplasmic protein of iron/siderophore ABC transporter n=2 Tax=Yersinia ruckeri TaxID=29486 RepID=A0A380S9Q7_YERRU|nr:periplasmic binding family protein [Yersinia ruckeri ATCC 29473]UIM86536.1 ABC transporter substrate-binding protein [Yersinia ruckeri]SUP97890.1 solute-binding periplasmic protein of iron/siderophore ABC transporter [Yersinia ruckeri]SUQ37306.1 solute-binding periplasmic protein of iron/siderophore ABC transporter [Yersinia ruckeri]